MFPFLSAPAPATPAPAAPTDPEAKSVPYLHPGRPPYNAPVPMDFRSIMPHNNGSTVHPTVVDFGPGETWNGHRFWMCINDFGTGGIEGGNHGDEDPYIVVSKDGFNWTEPSGISNPIADPTRQTAWGYSGGLNTDPELTYDPDTDTMHLWWRQDGTERILWHSSTTNGVAWATPTWERLDLNDWVAPAVVRMGPSDWRMWTWATSAGLRLRTASNPEGPWSVSTKCDGPGVITGGWHGDVIHYKGYFWLIVGGQVAASKDGLTWVGGQTVLGPGAPGAWDDAWRIYRTTMCPTQDGWMRVWYGQDGNATRNWQTGYTLIPQTAWPQP